jgi:hypothetical protein
MDDKLDFTPLPESDYDKLCKDLVDCKGCGQLLEDFEIKAHRFIFITDPKDMLCQVCWMRVAYIQGKKD